MHLTDVCELENEESIVDCLKKRFQTDNIYVSSNKSISIKLRNTLNNQLFRLQTYVAKVLIAINPFKHINDLYSEEIVNNYRNDQNDELPPHLYSIGKFFCFGGSHKQIPCE